MKLQVYNRCITHKMGCWLQKE